MELININSPADIKLGDVVTVIFPNSGYVGMVHNIANNEIEEDYGQIAWTFGCAPVTVLSYEDGKAVMSSLPSMIYTYDPESSEVPLSAYVIR